MQIRLEEVQIQEKANCLEKKGTRSGAREISHMSQWTGEFQKHHWSHSFEHVNPQKRIPKGPSKAERAFWLSILYAFEGPRYNSFLAEAQIMLCSFLNHLSERATYRYPHLKCVWVSEREREGGREGEKDTLKESKFILHLLKRENQFEHDKFKTREETGHHLYQEESKKWCYLKGLISSREFCSNRLCHINHIRISSLSMSHKDKWRNC